MADHFDADTIRYALAKQVPDMARGFSIHTSYGDIALAAEDAASVAELVRSILQRQLARAEVRHV
jgi:hypothetical protein